MSKKILVILGHPNEETFNGALFNTYKKAAKQAGHQLRIIKLGEIEFDPILHKGYKERQTLEPALEDAQKDIRWAEHLVFIYPTWWGGLPAILKGFLDRVFLPGYAFKYHKGNPLWDKLLKGKTANIITTMDAPYWYYKIIVGSPGTNQLKKSVLEFSGIKVTKIMHISQLGKKTEKQKTKILLKIENLAFSHK